MYNSDHEKGVFMRVKYKAKAKASWPLAKRNYVKKAVSWACRELDLVDLPINIIVRFVGESTDFGSAANPYEDNYYIVWLHAGSSWSRTARTVFHELTHVHQYVYQGLILENGRKAHYKGQTYDTDYWESPWEIEAWKAEKTLYRRFVNS